MARATGEFKITSWNEDTYKELEGGAKLTRASVTQGFTGDIEGEGAVEWLMCYSLEGTARFVGLQRVEGSLGGRGGSFVVECAGDFDGGQAKGNWKVVPGSATGDLTGLGGTGAFQAPLGSKASYNLDYELA